MLNAVFLTKPVYDEVELETRIKWLVIMLKAQSALVDDRGWIPEFLRPQIDEVFAGRGLVPLLTLTGMATEQLLPTTQSSKLNCVSVNSLEMRRAVADINAISNNLSLAPFAKL